MNDIRFRLERLREDHLRDELEAWRVAELREDCARLRALDREGELTPRLELIEELLGHLLHNLASLAKLEGLRERLKRLGSRTGER